MVNGTGVGSNTPTYTSNTLNSGDIVTCQLTSNALCATGSPATSNAINMTVNESKPVSVNIVANPGNSVCEGTPISFVATGVNGGSSPVYTWSINGTNAGTNSTTFTPSSLNNGDEVVCTLTSNEICAVGSPATSNTIFVTISPTTEGGVLSSMETEVCEGESTGLIILSGHVGDILYWQRRIDGGVWTNISNTAGLASFSEITNTSGVWEYRVIVQSGVCGVDTSSTVSINVLATPVASFTYNNYDPMFEFINTSTNATSYSWEFGDGATSTLESPVHTYNSANTYNVILTAFNGTCQSSYSETIDVYAVSIIELDNISLQMFPNPSNGEFFIELNGTNSSTLLMEIFDVTGKLIRAEDLSSVVSGGVFHVTLGDVNAGMYNIRFTHDDLSITRIMVIE